MGLCHSKHAKRGSLRRNAATNAALNAKIQAALHARMEEQAKLEHPMSFERILLKFDHLQDVLGYVKDNFLACSADGKFVDMAGLNKAITNIKGSRPSEEEVKEIFNFADLHEDVRINLKEFVVALTLGVVLDSINFGEEKVKLAPSPRRQSMSSFFGHPKEVYNMLSLIVSAYLLFDKDGSGRIQRDTVTKLLDERGHKDSSSSNAMLSQERWKELDWDENGQIDLAEFVHAFTMWVDMDNILSVGESSP